MSQASNQQYNEVVLSGSMAELRKLRVDYEVVSSNPNSYILAKGNIRADRTGSIGGPLFVTGDVTVGNSNNTETSSNLAVAGNLTVGNEKVGLHSSAYVAGEVNISGSGAVTGSFNVGKSLFVSESTSIKQNLTVEEGNVEVGGGHLAVKGIITGEGDLNISGSSKISKSLELGGDLEVGGSENIQGTSTIGKELTVGGYAQIKDSASIAKELSVGGDLIVSGDLELGGKLDIAGDFSVGGTFNLEGPVFMGSDLIVGGNLTVQGELTTLDVTNLTVEDKLIELATGAEARSDVDGAGLVLLSGSSDAVYVTYSYAKNQLATNVNLGVSGTVNVEGDTNISGSVKVSGSRIEAPNVSVLILSGGRIEDGNLIIPGDIKAGGFSVQNGNVQVSGNQVVSGTQVVLGQSLIEDDQVVQGNQIITGSLTVGKNLVVDTRLDVPSGAFGFVTTSEIRVTNSEGSGSVAAEFFIGDGRYLQNVTASIVTASRAVVPFEFTSEGGGTLKVDHGYNTENIVVVAYRQDRNSEGLEIATQIPVGVQIEDPNSVNVTVTTACKGYVVVLNAGQVISGSIDLLEWSTFRDDYDVSAGGSKVFTHRLGTYNVIVSTYRENIVDGEKVLEMIIPENTIIRDENHVEVFFNQDSTGYVVIGKAGHIVKNVDLVESCVSQSYVTVGDVDGSYRIYHGFGTDSVVVDAYEVVDTNKKVSVEGVVTTIEDENSVSLKFPEVGKYFIVISKGGHIVSGTVDLVGNGIHYGDTGDWSSNTYVCYTSMSTRVVKASEYVDTVKVGNLDVADGSHGYGPEHAWGSFTKYTDVDIRNFVSPAEGNAASEENSGSLMSILNSAGDLYLRGGIFPGNIKVTSDRRFKEDISTISGSLDLIQQLRGVDFTWKGSKKHAKGFIAQEVQEVCPDLVEEVQDLDNQEKLTLDPIGIIGLLLEAVKELNNKVIYLEQQNKTVE